MFNKVNIAAILLACSSSLFAIQAEQAYLYKDSRIMGMGGVDVAVGSYSTSVFSNPSGIARLAKSKGLSVELLGLGASMTQDITTFTKDVDDASDSEEELANVLKKYSGDTFHLGIDNYSSLSQHADAFAWSIGVLAASDVNIMAHSNGTASGDFIETSSRLYGGVVAAVAKPFYTDFGRLDIGLGVKYISQTSYEGTVGVYDYTSQDDFIENYEKESSGFGVDLGFTYHLLNTQNLHMAFGASLMNIGLDLDDNYGHQPMTLNFGLSATTKFLFIKKLIMAVDYVDSLGENKYREYNLSSNGSSTTYVDYDAYDFMKNFRAGVKMRVLSSQNFFTDINLGLYQSAYTAGVDMQLSAFNLSLATYAEDVGINENTRNSDRRYMAKIGLIW